MTSRIRAEGYAVPDAALSSGHYGEPVFSVKDVPILIAIAAHRRARPSFSPNLDAVVAHLNAAVELHRHWDQRISPPGDREKWAIGVMKIAEAFLAQFDANGGGGRFEEAAAIIRYHAAPLLEAGCSPSDERELRETARMMRRLAVEMRIVASAYAAQKTGRKSAPQAEFEFYKHICEAFRAAFGTEPRISNDPVTSIPGGPAMRFTRAVVGRMMRRMNRANLKRLGKRERIARGLSWFRGASLPKK